MSQALLDQKEALLYEKLPNQAVKCNLCQWYCKINEGHSGVCRVRLNRGGVLYAPTYGEVASVAVDPIEKKPLFHFYPGSKVFSLGTWGCNMRCQHCQNWQISYAIHDGGWRLEGQPVQGERLSPQQAVALTVRHGCGGIAWTYNEPTIWFEYTLDCARLAKERGLYTVYVTNGFISPEALDTIGPYLDAFRVDVKGFSDGFYKGLAKVGRWRTILDMAERAKFAWKMHVEVIYNVIPTMNDDDEQFRQAAEWVRDRLGPETPWHITRFYPHAHLSHLPPTPIATLLRGRETGLAAGLHFVYLGNVPGGEGEDTPCYRCGRTAIRRAGYHTQIVSLRDGLCGHCGADLNIRR